MILLLFQKRSTSRIRSTFNFEELFPSKIKGFQRKEKAIQFALLM